MRRTDREITEIGEIERIISKARYLHLGLFDEKFPYIVPLHYVYRMNDERLTFYVHCASEGHKMECIKKNSHVFVQIDNGESLILSEIPCKCGAQYESVMCRGKAVIVEDSKEKCQVLELFMKFQTGREFHIDEKMSSGVTVVRIEVESYTAKARIK